MTMTNRMRSFWNGVFLVSVLAGCDRTPITPPIPVTSKNPPRQVMQMSPFFLDEVGEISQEFDVVNRTDLPIKFVNVLKSCTCTEAHLDKDDLLPNESTKLRMTVRPGQRSGKNSVVCGIVDEAGIKREYSISYYGYHRITFSRPALTFGRITSGREQTLPFQVMAYSLDATPPATAVEVVADDSEIRVERSGDELLALDGGASVRRFSFRLVVPPGKTESSGNSMVLATIRTEDKTSTANCPVSWTVASQFTVSPPRIFISRLARQDDYHAQVTIQRTDSHPFRIVAVTASNPAIKVARIADGDALVEAVSIELSGRDLEKAYSNGTITATTESTESSLPVEIPFAVRRTD